jgi:hypothetical protein
VFETGGPEERLFGGRSNLKNYPAVLAFINAEFREHTMSKSAHPSRCRSEAAAPVIRHPAELLAPR